MALDPATRYRTAAAVANDLQAFLAKRPTTLDRSRTLRALLWCRRNPQLASTGLIALVLSLLAAGTHATVTRLRSERNALNTEVERQQAEQRLLNASVEQSKRDLDETSRRLRTKREALTALETTLSEDRAAHAALLEDKDRALRDATEATRRRAEELEKAQRDLAASQSSLDRATREAQRVAKERDRVRHERDAARAERDAAQTERDNAITERENAERQLESLRSVAKNGTPKR
jgi:chromosome segregation ATPase